MNHDTNQEIMNVPEITETPKQTERKINIAKPKNLFISIATSILLISPAFSNIGANDSSASCDNSTIGASSGTTTLEAQWQANTIDVYWYDGNTAINPSNSAASECTYDQAMALPSNTLSKEGYTFDGWTVKPNILASLDSTIVGSHAYGHDRYNNADYCAADGSSANCSTLTDIALNEWKTEFSYGTVYGIASCNDTESVTANTVMPQLEAGTLSAVEAKAMLYGSESDAIRNGSTFNKNSSGRYCWCKATGYTPLNGTKQVVAGTSWVISLDFDTSTNCAAGCAYGCGEAVQYGSGLRPAVFTGAL